MNQEEEKKNDNIEERIKQLKEERDKALSHVVGTAYYWQVAKEKNEELKLLLEKK